MQREVEHNGQKIGKKREVCGSGGRIEKKKYELNGTSIKRHENSTDERSSHWFSVLTSRRHFVRIT
jgi:hypothetical protein